MASSIRIRPIPISITRPYIFTYNPIKRYVRSSEESEAERERAPSLAQEFKRVEQERLTKSHNSDDRRRRDKTSDDGDGDGDAAKEKQLHPPAADHSTK